MGGTLQVVLNRFSQVMKVRKTAEGIKKQQIKISSLTTSDHKWDEMIVGDELSGSKEKEEVYSLSESIN